MTRTFVFLLCLFILGKGEPFWPIYLKVGDVCPENQVIATEQECIKALEDLNLPQPTIKYSGSWASIPRGCSYRPAGFGGANEGHFSTTKTGAGRVDLRPVCKATMQYSCKNKGCHWGSYVKNTHWGYYSETNGDCQNCKSKCSADSNCGAYECGSGYCSWWKKGMCSESDSKYNYKTCRATGVEFSSVKYRLNSNPNEMYWNLGEVQLYKEGEKIAINPTCTASSTAYDTLPCGNIFDENTSTYWSPNWSGENNYWFEFFAGDADEIRIWQSAHPQEKATLTRTIYSYGEITKTDSQVLELSDAGGWEIHSIGLFNSRITGLNAELSSAYNGETDGSKCIDGNVKTMCHGQNSGGDTLTITLPKYMLLNRIEIVNRPDNNGRLVGAIVKAGSTECATIEDVQLIYNIECGDEGEGVETDRVTIKTNTWFNVMEVRLYGDDAPAIPYSCTDQSCQWNNYVEGTDWGYYSKSLGDCQTCKNLCSADPNCGAVECGDNYCSWWKNGVCTESDSNSNYNTCRAITVCEPQFNMNKHVCSSNFGDNFFGEITKSDSAAVTVLNIIGSLLSMAKFTVCFGNLNTEEFNEKKGDAPMEDHGCGTMIPTTGRFSSVSFQDPVMNFGACTLISSCESLPTVAFGLNDEILDFIFAQIASLAVAGAVPSPLIKTVLEKVESSVAMGISLTGDFVYEITYWRGGRNMNTIDFRGHFFFSMSNKISLWTLISPPAFIQKATKKLEKYTAKLTPYTDKAGRLLPDWINDKIDVEESILKGFKDRLDHLLMLKATTTMMLDLSAIEEGVGEAIDCVVLGICETSASDMMQKVLYGTNFLLQASGDLVLDLKQILPTLPELNINLESAQFLKYGYGIYVQFGLDQTELVEGLFGPMCEMFGIDSPRVALQMQAYVNDHGIGLQGDATWFQINCKFTWKEKSLDCDINGDTFSAFIEMIGEALELLGDVAHQVVTKAGKVIEAGWKSAAQKGDEVWNGLVLGVSTFKGRAKDVWDGILGDISKWWSLDEFCDCNMRGQLQIMSQDTNNNEIRYLSAQTGMSQRVTWSTNVHKVKWRCKDDDNWKYHTMDHSGRIWSVEYRYEDKSPCPNFDGAWYKAGMSNTRSSGRVTFITTEDVGVDTSESVEAYVGTISPEERAELNKESDQCPQCQEVYKAYHDCQSAAVGTGGECFHRDGKIALKCSLRVCEDQYIENTKCHHTHCDPNKPPEAKVCLEQYHEWSYCVIDADIQTCQDELTPEEENQCMEETCKETKTLLQECLDKAHDEASVGQGNEFVHMTSNSLLLPFGVLFAGIVLVYIVQRRNNKIEETMPLLEEEL